MIYLASPYSHEDETVRLDRFHSVCHVAAELMGRGELVFSPIAHTHSIAKVGALPLGWEFWKRLDQRFLVMCDSVWVLTLAGWEESVGVQAEIEMATRMEMQITYTDLSAFNPRKRKP